jgi:VanZ family protein
MHKTSAWPLALFMAVLIVYASLYPFAGWRDQGVQPWAYLIAPLPQYWIGFDIISNLLGYAPLGFLLVVGALRSQPGAHRQRKAFLLSSLACTVLSFTMESLQSYLPVRTPSNVDLLTNVLGGSAGAGVAVLLHQWGALDRWSSIRSRWIVPQARGAIVLLALWPAALLFPPAVPLGLGQLLDRLEPALAGALQGTPFLDWLPMRTIEMQPMVPAAEMLCVALGALIPCFIGYSVIRAIWQRTLFFVAIFAAGTGTSALSSALSYGPSHAWGWLSPPVVAGLGLASLLALALVALPRRGCASLALLALAISLTLLNNAPTTPYFAQTLQKWEQGSFIHFYGLAKWLGWLWPYAALSYVLVRVSGSDAHSTAL